ncbi:MAG: aminotransferase class V-fold PLP-dependent enzyme [Bryobacteraceae bacterium]|nr:aminotransferase class V-fold PLP-dependent enzyme [Bryobacteraceae bacterium]
MKAGLDAKAARQAPARERVSQCDLPPEEFRRAGHRLVDRLADFLAALPQGSVTPAEPREAVRALIGADRPLPEGGRKAEEIVEEAAELLIAHSLFNGHPRFFGYITAGPAPIGALAELLAATINPNVGAWKLAPAASEIEAQTVRWIAEFIGFPVDAGGLLVSGGNMANLVGFLAARATQLGSEIRSAGIGSLGRRPRCYCSAETHTWIQKAADLSGLGTDSIRWTPCDDRGRMRVAVLAEQIAQDRAAGDLPFLVVGTAGSVSTGAVDPLPELASLCQQEGLWFHVDGAYGGLAARVPGVPEELRGLSLADSVAVDPHKWLYAPLEAGCALVREWSHLRNAFSYRPPYYNFEQEALNYFDVGPQNSRGFRALKVWMAFQQAGRQGYMESVGADIELAGYAYRWLDAHPEFEVHSLGLSVCTFRYVPPALAARDRSEETERRIDQVNRDLLEKIEASGEAFLSNAVVGGRYLLRLCVVNFRTTAADIERLPELIARLGREAVAS